MVLQIQNALVHLRVFGSAVPDQNKNPKGSVLVRKPS